MKLQYAYLLASVLSFVGTTPAICQNVAPAAPQLQSIGGDANPMLDEMLTLPLEQRNLVPDRIDPAAGRSTVNPNFSGFRVAPYYPAHKAGDTTKIISGVEGDFNNDGRMDMVSFQQSSMTLMLGDGKGGFSNGGSQTLSASGSIYHPVAVDLNHDGYPDIVAMTAPFAYSGTVVVIMNLKNETFAAPITISKKASVYSGLTNFNLADIDGDGNLDVVISGSGTTDAITYTNSVFEVIYGNGDGTFRTSTAIETDGVLPYKATFGYDGGTALRIVNGQLTLFVTVVTSTKVDGTNFESTQIYKFPVNANGSLVVANAPYIDLGNLYTTSPNRYLQFKDLDGDGVEDLIFIQGDGDIYTALGNADGTFQAIGGALPAAFADSTAVVSFRDIDNDGKLDAVVPGASLIAVYPGNGDGTFNLPQSTYLAGFGTSANAGLTFPVTANVVDDFDGDGLADIIYYDLVKRSLNFYKGKADGTFIGALALSQTTGYYQNNVMPIYAAPDLNGDGYKDVVVNSGYGILSGLNDGKGNFTYQPVAPLLTSVSGISSTSVDFDKDGRDDVLFFTLDKNYYFHIFIGYSNGDGTVNAVEQVLPFESLSTPLVAIGDVSGDGYPDLVITQTDYTNKVFGVWTMINDGKGHLQKGTFLSLGSTTMYGITLGDINGDGKADLFVSYGAYSATTVAEWINPGTGDFNTATPSIIQSTLPVGLIVAKEATGDGKIDLLLSVTNGSSEGIQLYPGNGDGTFGTPTALETGIVVGTIDVNDYNGDGVPDIVFTNYESVLSDANDGILGIVVLRGIGDGTFATPVSSAVYGSSRTIFSVDLVHNGSPSILVQSPAAGTTILLNRGSSSLAIKSSATALTTASTITETVSVSPYYSDQGTPTGTIALLVDGTPYGTSTLDASGTAVFSLSSLPVGTHSVTATYAGDSNFNVNTHSGTTTLTVTQAIPVFLLTTNTSAFTLQQGATGTATISLTANAAFSGPVSLTCTGVPLHSSCNFDQTSVTLAPGQTATATLTLTTQSTASAMSVPHLAGAGISGIAVAGLLLIVPVFRKKRLPALLALILSVWVFPLSGCSHASDVAKATAGTYAVTVTASPGDTTVAAQKVVIALTIQHN